MNYKVKNVKSDSDPILFHEFKHHLKTGETFIVQNKNLWNKEIESKLKTLGNSQFDYYIGELLPIEIKCQIFIQLQKMNCVSKTGYFNWLGGNKGYKELRISDNSLWTLRFVEKEKYIHIHPSRYSQNTIRIKAGTLKTVLCTLLFENEFSYSLLNKYRVEKLALSPINEKGNHRGIEHMFSYFL